MSVTVRGLFDALSVKTKVPLAAPVALGENVTLTLHLAFDVIGPVPQEFLAIAKPALATMLEKLDGVTLIAEGNGFATGSAVTPNT